MTKQTENFRIDVDTAVRLIADHMPTYPSESVLLESARGAILRQQVVADHHGVEVVVLQRPLERLVPRIFEEALGHP